MPDRKSSTSRTVLLGLFFLVALGVLAYYTLFLTDFTLFSKPTILSVRFSETNGLREGDSVLVAGMRWGKVKSLEYDPSAPNDRRITVVATLKEDLVLRRGFKIQIQDATLLGGKNLSVDPGPAGGELVPPGEMLFGEVGVNPLASLGDLVAESQRGVSVIIQDLSTITQGVREGRGPLGRIVTDERLAQDLSDTLQGAARTLANLEQISSNLSKGQGMAGQLLVNRELYDELLGMTRKLNRAFDEIGGLVDDFREGRGALPRLFTDDQMAEDLAGTVAGLRSIVTRIERGEGTIGMLVNDETIARDVAGVTQKLASGEGAIGAFLTKSEIYDNLRETTENLAVVTGAVREGQGSLGRLVMDEEVYQSIKTALRIVQRALEEYREAAPVTTFTSVFFGAF